VSIVLPLSLGQAGRDGDLGDSGFVPIEYLGEGTDVL